MKSHLSFPVKLTDDISFKASAIRDASILEDGSQQGRNGLPHIPTQHSLVASRW